MSRLTSAVHWWEDSQMRVLVLCSLVAQFLLYIFTYLRIRAIIPGWIRFLTWLAYLGGDAIAIYALATLFNRHKQEDRGGGGGALEVVWAPILLLHLGGNDGITAYNIEDNELWTRHLLTAVSQVTVAVYVFCKSWPWPGGDMRLLLAAIVLFVPGVLKCFAKPWDLKRASIKSLVSLPAAQRTRKQKQGMKHLEEYVRVQPATTTSKLKQVLSVREQKGTGADDEQTQGGARASVEDGDNNPVPPPPRGSGAGDIPPIQGCRRRSRQRKRDALPQGKQNEGEMDTLEQYVKGAMAFIREQKDGEQKGEDEVSSTSRAPAVGDMDSDHLPSQQGDDNDIISSSQDHGQLRREREGLDQLILDGEAYNLFVDLPSPYPLRLSIFKCFWVLSQERVEKVCGSVRHGLASAFIYLYTKLNKPDLRGLTLFCWRQLYDRGWIQILRLWLPWPAIGLFHHSHREAYSGVDVKITYALFCCTAVLEFCSIFFAILVSLDVKKEWPGMVAQYNLIGYFARDKNNSNKVWIASKSGCKDFLDQHWSMESCFSSGTIVELVLQYLKAGWKEKIHDPGSYHKFNDNRGQWALEGNEQLGWSIKGPFDESVVLWHIATDFCLFLRSPPMSSSGEQPTSQKTVQCRQMSNYMMHLLFVNPEMLLPGTRRYLFTIAYNELKDILGENKPSLFATAYKELKDILMENEQNVYRRVRNAMKEVKEILADNKRNPISRSQWNPKPVKEEGVIERVISSILDKSTQASEDQESKQGSEEESGCKQNFITDAWALAQGLLALGDDKMWEVIQGVWVEMLCFSASRCRGYLHAKALGSGGEFLSYVWLLLFYMGMETFTERLQREELPSREANNNGAPPPSDAHSGNATTSSSTSWIPSSGASSSTSHLHTGASTSSSEIHIVDMD